MRTASWTDSTSVLDRVAAVLDAFGENDDGLGVSELARRANLPKSTVSRIAGELVGQRFLDREGDTLYLGVRLFELGQAVEQPRRLRQLALPVMKELRDLTGHTVALGVLAGSDVVLVAIVRGQLASVGFGRVGSRLPAHATALGKAILAFSATEVVDDIVGEGLSARTPSTIREPAAFARELAETRRMRTAGEREECAVSRAAIAGPILGPADVPLAAISVVARADGLVVERIAPAVRAAAATLSHRLSGSGRAA